MKLLNTVLTLTLVFKYLQYERTKSYEDYLAKRATQQPLEQPRMKNPSKYGTLRIDTSSTPNRPYMKGIITNTTATSKYTPEELQAFYKINPYTNL